MGNIDSCESEMTTSVEQKSSDSFHTADNEIIMRQKQIKTEKFFEIDQLNLPYENVIADISTEVVFPTHNSLTVVDREQSTLSDAIKKDEYPDSNTSIFVDNLVPNPQCEVNSNSSTTIGSKQTLFTVSNSSTQSPENEQILFKKLPFLSSFKPAYAKRETIDKKIMRNFRQFLIHQNNAKKLNLEHYIKDANFNILWRNNMAFPPINFIDANTNDNVQFKSFNSNYLLWFFSKEGIKELYELFIINKGTTLINDMRNYYKINDKDKMHLMNYVNNLPFIFDITLVKSIQGYKSNTTSNSSDKAMKEVYNFGHWYRKSKSKKELRLERSREYENGNEMNEADGYNLKKRMCDESDDSYE